MNVLELFAGSRSVSRAAELKGHNTFSIDWTDYNGIDLVTDIAKLKIEDVPFIPDMIWASPDCTTYSIAGHNSHRSGNQRDGFVCLSEYAHQCDETNIHFISLIKQWLEINPNMVFFIENPRGLLRHMEWMKEFRRETVWYCRYGDSRAKPTDIWTNSTDWTPRPLCANHRYDKDGNVIDRKCHHEIAQRGMKTGTQGLKLTYDKSKIPVRLCLEIINSVK